VTEGPSESVGLPDKHNIDVPPVRVGHEPIQFRTGFLGTGNANVHILTEHIPSAPGSIREPVKIEDRLPEKLAGGYFFVC
jgi:hypothetical protein